MRCSTSKKLIHLEVSGELDATRCRELLQHMETCASCRSYHARMEETRLLLREVKPVSAPVSLRYLVGSRLGLVTRSAQSGWFATLQFRMLDSRLGDCFRATIFAVPITVVFLVVISLTAYSHSGLENLESYMADSKSAIFQQNLVERQYLQNLYDFTPEIVSGESVYQPRISTVPVKLFAENEFQNLPTDQIGVLATVSSSGKAEVEEVSGGGKVAEKKVRDMLDHSIIFPAIHQGKNVDSKVVLTFQKIEVKG